MCSQETSLAGGQRLLRGPAHFVTQDLDIDRFDQVVVGLKLIVAAQGLSGESLTTLSGDQDHLGIGAGPLRFPKHIDPAYLATEFTVGNYYVRWTVSDALDRRAAAVHHIACVLRP